MKKNKFFKNRPLIAFLAGAFCSLAFSPFNCFIAATVSFSIFYFLLEETPKHAHHHGHHKKLDKKQIFFIGFCYGFGYFLAGVYWISISLFVDIEKFFWLVPFAIILIPAVLAMYIGLFTLTYKWLVRELKCVENYQRILVFSVAWLCFEVLRSQLYSGFPWNLIGYIWMFDPVFAQSASIFGVYGLSLFAVLICLFPVLFLNINTVKKIKEITLGDEILAVFLTMILLGNLTYGFKRIDEQKIVKDSETKLRLVQANIKQEIKWDPQQKYKNFAKHIEMTNSRDLTGVKAVIWSETSVPYVIDDNPELLEKLRLATPPKGSLITGGLRVARDSESPEKISNIWNSVFLLEENGVRNFYDKHHLVPFGEYVPLQKYLPFLEKITDGAVGFSSGPGPKTLQAEAFSFSPLLCYEVIFSNNVIDQDKRPDLLVNLTNDAWFGNSPGPYQHFVMARMRAIEEGISLARVAGSGITAYIDPFGRIVKKIGLNEEGMIDVALIKKLEPTIFEKYSYLPLILLITVICVFLTFSPPHHHATRQNHSR